MITVRVGCPQKESESFTQWLWASFGPGSATGGLLGVHEGTMLTEEAFDRGFETESWIVDSGVAPEHRDWVGDKENLTVDLYFASRPPAEKARAEIQKHHPGLKVGEILEETDRDWNAEWRANFKGIKVSADWEIIPPWQLPEAPSGSLIQLKINPGAGFGTGTHETTQLCLEAIASLKNVHKNRKESPLKGLRCLDFGSGSGILSVALAALGAQACGVEIDPLANENAAENAKLNGVESRVRFQEHLDPGERYDIVVANILRPVLIDYAERLVRALDEKGSSTLILSGLIESDLVHIFSKYEPLMGGSSQREVFKRGDWRALRWRKA